MTTPDPTTGRFAAARRTRRVAMLCAAIGGCLFALPALAIEPAAAAASTVSLVPASLAAPATATATPLPAMAAARNAGSPVATPPAAADRDLHDAIVVLDAPAPMSDRALLLASDIGRLIAKPSTTATGDTAPASAASRIQDVLQRALTLLGTPYRWGGTTTDGFDCSGLVGYVFRTTLGIDLPRVSRDMARTGKEVDRASLVPGDLVFFGRRGRVDHVGIYLGEGRFVHAPRTGRDVTVSNLDGYWGRKFLEARRVAGI